MPTFYSRGIQNPTTAKSANALYGGTAIRGMQDAISMTTAMVIGDTIELGMVPSSAILLPTSTIIHAGLGAGVTLDVGFDAGGSGFAEKLGNNLDVASAGTKAGLAAVAVANQGKRVWEIAGFAADPRRELKMVMTVGGANVGTAGVVFYHFQYVS